MSPANQMKKDSNIPESENFPHGVHIIIMFYSRHSSTNQILSINIATRPFRWTSKRSISNTKKSK